MSPELLDRAQAGFAAAFGGAPALGAYAPGRVNLIGEHTDYNDGFVLPCGIGCGTVVLARPRADRTINLAALDLGEMESFAADSIGTGAPWSNYVRGVAALIGPAACGADIAIAGDVPQGAGLSSSASLEVATGAALAALWRIERTPTDLARIGQRAEHEFAGCQCGIMDQLVSARAEPGSALLIDCRSLDCTPVFMPGDWRVVIVQSRVRRELVDSAYNQRRRECEAVARHYGVAALRDLDMAALQAGKSGLDKTAYRRARHVVSENARTLAAAKALAAVDLSALHALFSASHASMRDDFEITAPAINRLAEIVAGVAGGARMTGGGFGGCVVTLAPSDGIAAIEAAIDRDYRSPEGLPAGVIVAEPSEGVRLL